MPVGGRRGTLGVVTATTEVTPKVFDLGLARDGAAARAAAAQTGLGRPQRAYYAVKHLLPRRTQIHLRRAAAVVQRRTLGDWPMHPRAAAIDDAALWAELDRRGADEIDMLGLWPDGRRFAFVLTHDVETAAGLEAIESILALEARYGMRSAWFLVGADYVVDAALLDRLRDAGCEVGLHGLHHNGDMFAGEDRFRAALPLIADALARWGAVGFRSPATRRNGAWMRDLGCLYDSSFPDDDPFEPQPGGAGTVLPFFLGDVVELPITLPQDHTLVEILGLAPGPVWTAKADWIAARGGLVNVIVHPDYTRGARRLADYEHLLAHLAARTDAWHALPREVASWWRGRTAVARGEVGTVDAARWAPHVTIARARRTEDGIVVAP